MAQSAKLRGAIYASATLLAGLCALVGVLGTIGGAAASLDFLNQFLPLTLASGTAFGLAGIVTRAGSPWPLWLSLGFLAAVAASQLAPEIAARVAQPNDDLAGIRIVQMNIYKANATPAVTAAWILQERPDVLLLEEALTPGQEVRKALSAEFPYQVSCLSRMRCSTIIMSRYRPKDAGGLARGDPENRRAVSAAWAIFGSPRGDILVVAAHMERPWPFGDQAPARRRIGELLDSIGQQGRDLAIVGGDFNLTPWTAAMRRQDKLFGLNRLSRARPTWPAVFPLLPIDHLYAGEGWRLSRLITGPNTGSDHRPLSATLVPAEG